VSNRKAVIGSLMSRQDLPMPVEEMLVSQSSASSSCRPDPVAPCDSSRPTTSVTPVTADVTSEIVDVGDVSVTLSVPVANVGSLSAAVDSNQTVSSLVIMSYVYVSPP